MSVFYCLYVSGAHHVGEFQGAMLGIGKAGFFRRGCLFLEWLHVLTYKTNLAYFVVESALILESQHPFSCRYK